MALEKMDLEKWGKEVRNILKSFHFNKETEDDAFEKCIKYYDSTEFPMDSVSKVVRFLIPITYD